MSIPAGRRGRVLLGSAIVGTAIVAVAVALIVVAATRPSDAELRREVATDLGVPEALLDVPAFGRVVDLAGGKAKDSVLEELDTSLVLGGLAGIASAMVLAAAIVWLNRPGRSWEAQGSAGQRYLGPVHDPGATDMG